MSEPIRDDPGIPESGPGALCPEAQADGVPCPEVGSTCERCERALADTAEGPEEETVARITGTELTLPIDLRRE